MAEFDSVNSERPDYSGIYAGIDKPERTHEYSGVQAPRNYDIVPQERENDYSPAPCEPKVVYSGLEVSHGGDGQGITYDSSIAIDQQQITYDSAI